MPLVLQPYKLPFRIRQSTLETARCLFRFHKLHVLGQSDPESEFAQRGTDFHALGKGYVDYLCSSKQDSDWEYGEELVNSRNWNLEAVGIFKNWIRSQSIDTETIFATEYKIRLDWNLQPVHEEDADAEERIVFSADIDRLHIRGTEAVAHDYKTHFASFRPTTIQAIVYSWLIFKLFPHIDTVKFQLEFVRWGISPEAREFSREDIPMMDRYVEQQILRLIAALETDEWPATVNSKCSFCLLECPLVEAGLTQEAIGQVQTQDHAEEMTRQLYALRQASTRLHAHLKNWAMRNGPIDAGNDIRLGFSKSSRFEFDTKTIMALNEQHGFAATRGLKPSAAEVKKIAKRYPEYLAEARKTAKDKSTTKFNFWNEIGDPMGDDEEDGE